MRSQRRLYRNQVSGLSTGEFILDTNPDDLTKEIFNVIRLSDSATMNVARQDINNGTYANWISGTTGEIIDFAGQNLTISAPSSDLRPRLLTDGRIYGYAQGRSLFALNEPNLTEDWVITCVMGPEEQSNSARINFAVFDSSASGVSVQRLLSGTSHINIDQNSSPSSHRINYANGAKNLWTFTKINGVYNATINNAASGLFMSAGTVGVVNAIGSTSLNYTDGTAFGKINKYDHLACLSGSDLSGLDIAAHRQLIMNKYGL